MKYVVVFFWSFLLVQVTYFLGTALQKLSYHVADATIASVLIAIAVVVIAALLPKISTETPPHSI